MTRTAFRCPSCGAAARPTSSGHILCDSCGAVSALPEPTPQCPQPLSRAEREVLERERAVLGASTGDARMEAAMRTLVVVAVTMASAAFAGVLADYAGGIRAGVAAAAVLTVAGAWAMRVVWRRSLTSAATKERIRTARLAEIGRKLSTTNEEHE